ncbi:MAG TPA: hypothetical protein VNX01_09270 [Bacteroidia bacterium]|jgi:hypothetical protein|nr:hypothetical protein [Bacteroidia bacterium]
MGEVNRNKRALLITGTIVPNSNFVAHTNVEERRKEYYDSLLFYSNNFKDDDLFFLENSSYDFEKDAEFQKMLADRKITLLKFPISDKFNQGKGYQEFEMLDKAIEKLATEYNSFIKITGRYKVMNLKQLTNFNCESLVADFHKKNKVSQTNVFYVSGSFYITYLKGLYLQVDDSKGVYIEKIVYNKIETEKLEKKVMLFSLNPIIVGISGSYGGTLNRNKIKMKIRNVERKLLKVFGINQFLIEY